MLNQPDIIPTAWAANNDTKSSIPATTVETGKASWDQGFPVETGKPLSQGGVPPRYGDINGILNALSEFAVFAQSGGNYAWSATLDYVAGCVVLGSDGVLYKAERANGVSSTVTNPVNDSTGTWSELLSKADLSGDMGYVNAADYGAKGDWSRTFDIATGTWTYAAEGTATDDTDALQLAFDTAAAEGKACFIPSGTYKISDTLWIPSNIRIYGAGKDVTTIRMSSTVTSAWTTLMITGWRDYGEDASYTSGVSYEDAVKAAANSGRFGPRENICLDEFTLDFNIARTDRDGAKPFYNTNDTQRPQINGAYQPIDDAGRGCCLAIVNTKHCIVHNVRAIDGYMYDFDVSSPSYMHWYDITSANVDTTSPTYIKWAENYPAKANTPLGWSRDRVTTYDTDGCEDVWLIGCEASGGGDDNITTHYSNNVHILHCHSQYPDGHGLTGTKNCNCYELDDGTTNAVIDNCVAVGGKGGVSVQGHMGCPCANGIIIDNVDVFGSTQPLVTAHTKWYTPTDISEYDVDDAKGYIPADAYATSFGPSQTAKNLTIGTIHLHGAKNYPQTEIPASRVVGVSTIRVGRYAEFRSFDGVQIGNILLDGTGGEAPKGVPFSYSCNVSNTQITNLTINGFDVIRSGRKYAMIFESRGYQPGEGGEDDGYLYEVGPNHTVVNLNIKTPFMGVQAASGDGVSIDNADITALPMPALSVLVNAWVEELTETNGWNADEEAAASLAATDAADLAVTNNWTEYGETEQTLVASMVSALAVSESWTAEETAAASTAADYAAAEAVRYNNVSSARYAINSGSNRIRLWNVRTTGFTRPVANNGYLQPSTIPVRVFANHQDNATYDYSGDLAAITEGSTAPDLRLFRSRTSGGNVQNGDICGYLRWFSRRSTVMANVNNIYGTVDDASGGYSSFTFQVRKTYSGFSGVSLSSTELSPLITDEISLGNASATYKDIYNSDGLITGSDERIKQDVDAIPDAVFRAWERVGFCEYRYRAAVEKKGEAARLHFGLIAQRVKEAFEAEGMDAFTYGLLCYDEWDAKEAVYDDVEVVDVPAVRDENGVIVEPAQTHFERQMVMPAREAGNRYSLRYSECLALEAAYQRRRAERAETRIAALERRFDELEAALATLGGQGDAE